MTNSPLSKIECASAVEICASFDLSKQARLSLRAGMQPGEFVEALAAKKDYLTGIDFLAHGLPAREAVWWGCLCVQQTFGASLLLRDKQACRAAVQWVLQPTEQNRAAAKIAAESAGPGSPCGALGLAVAHTGNNAAGSQTLAKTVAGCVKLASAQSEPVKIVDTQRLFLELGVGVAQGRFTWQACLGAPHSWRWQREVG